MPYEGRARRAQSTPRPTRSPELTREVLHGITGIACMGVVTAWVVFLAWLLTYIIIGHVFAACVLVVGLTLVILMVGKLIQFAREAYGEAAAAQAEARIPPPPTDSPEGGDDSSSA